MLILFYSSLPGQGRKHFLLSLAASVPVFQAAQALNCIFLFFSTKKGAAKNYLLASLFL